MRHIKWIMMVVLILLVTIFMFAVAGTTGQEEPGNIHDCPLLDVHIDLRVLEHLEDLDWQLETLKDQITHMVNTELRNLEPLVEMEEILSEIDLDVILSQIPRIHADVLQQFQWDSFDSLGEWDILFDLDDVRDALDFHLDDLDEVTIEL